MPRIEAGEWTFVLSGGRLCMDFANTVSWRSSHHIERLKTYKDLVAWSRQARLLTDDQARALTRKASRRPGESARIVQEAVALREAIYRIFAGFAASSPPLPADLFVLNGALAKTLVRRRVVPVTRGFAWDWMHAEALDYMLGAVAESAADLLTSSELRDVRLCAADNCGWIFVDTTRNHSRRWCAMDVCGNRAKVRRFYRRTKAIQAADG